MFHIATGETFIVHGITQEKISENSGYFGIRDRHLNDRKVVTYSEERCLNVPEYPMIFFNNFSISKSVSEFLN